MSPSDDRALTGAIFEDSTVLTLEDLSRMCAVDQQHIVEYVAEGVIHAVASSDQWHFSGAALRRTRLALRLERDLEINLAGVALALELLDELQQLRRDQAVR